MKWVRSGHNRDCWLIGRWAIKTPTLRNGWRYFVSGLLCNIQERSRWETSQHRRRARLIWASPGGWMNVYERYDRVLERPLTAEELKALPVFNPDPKHDNYAFNEWGEIVVLDYGHCDCYVKHVKQMMTPASQDTKGEFS